MTTSGVRRISDDQRAKDIDRHLSVKAFDDGRVLGRCRVCPRKVYDIRMKQKNGAQQSSYLADSADIAEAWFTAHAASDLHQYYLNPQYREPSLEERKVAQIFGKPPPPRRVVPFRYERKFR